MLKEKADAKTSEEIIKKPMINSLIGPCDYDEELDKTIRSFYPDAINWYLGKAERFDMKKGYAFIVLVKVPGLKRSRFLHLRCCESKDRGYYFISSLTPIKKENDKAKQELIKATSSNKHIIMKIE